MTKAEKAERAEAIARLREWLQPGDTVHCILRHVSSSGMTRMIQFVKMAPDGSPRYLGHNIAEALGMTYNRRWEGVKVQGCGMDMGFHVVYNIGRVLFPGGFGLWPLGGKDMPKAGIYERPKTQERAAQMVAQGFKFRGRNGDASGWDDDGGYALKCVWL